MDGEESFKTSTGSFVSLILLIIILIYASAKAGTMLTRGDTKHSETKLEIEEFDQRALTLKEL